ncbi:hypothetical protein ACHAWF_006038 [Thalassiosira exigua]
MIFSRSVAVTVLVGALAKTARCERTLRGKPFMDIRSCETDDDCLATEYCKTSVNEDLKFEIKLCNRRQCSTHADCINGYCNYDKKCEACPDSESCEDYGIFSFEIDNCKEGCSAWLAPYATN